MGVQKQISVVFYKTLSGNEPVREWLNCLSVKERKAIGEDIRVVELTWPVGLPLVRKIDSDLWEVRSHLSSKIARVFFTVWENKMVLLHGYVKKTQKAPGNVIDIARKRRDDINRGGIRS